MPSPRRRAIEKELPWIAALALAVSAPTIGNLALGPCLRENGHSDTLSQILPSVDLHRRSLGEGALPLWNGRQLFGVPLAGSPPERIFYPPEVVHALLPPPASLHVLELVHALVLAIGTYLLLRGERCRPASAFAGALLLGLCLRRFAYLVCGWETIFGPFAWTPLALFFFRRALRVRSVRPAILLGVALALSLLAGVPHFVAALALGLPVVGLAEVVRADRARRLRLARTLAVAFGLAAALAAPSILASLELSRASTRGDLATSYGERLSATPRALLDAFARTPSSFPNFWWERWNYLGFVALPLAFAGLVRPRESGRGRSFPCALLVVFAVLAIGEGTFVGRAVSRLPVLGELSHWSRVSWLAALGLALLAGRGHDALVRLEGKRSSLALALALGAGAVVTLVAARPRLLAVLDASHEARRDDLVALAFSSCAVFLPFIVAARPRVRRALLAGLVALAGVELLWHGERVMGRRVPFREVLAQGEQDAELTRDPDSRLAVLAENPWRDPVLPYFPHRIDRTGGYRSLLPRETARFLEAIEGRVDLSPEIESAPGFRPFFELENVARPDLLALGTTHVLSRAPFPEGELVGAESRTLLPHLGGTLAKEASLYRVRDALPRAFVMTRARSVPGSEQLAAMTGCARFPGKTLLLVEGPVPAELEGESEPARAARIVERSANRVLVEVAAPASGGWLVLLEAFSPDWKATVDGEPAAIARADHLFRAVRIPAGVHRVGFAIGLPASFLRGLPLFFLGGAGAVLAWLLSGRMRGP